MFKVHLFCHKSVSLLNSYAWHTGTIRFHTLTEHQRLTPYIGILHLCLHRSFTLLSLQRNFTLLCLHRTFSMLCFQFYTTMYT